MEPITAREKNPVVCLMLKAPRPGLVKTRLAREVGDAEAARIYRRLVEFQMSRLGADCLVEVHYTPADAEAEMRAWLGEEPSYAPQGEGDLGDRMRATMGTAFGRGARRVIFLGGDCPYVDREILRGAGAALDIADVVLGPAADGGYYLIGMKRPWPVLFERIEWGTGAVRRQTLDRAAGAGLRVAELGELEDVDDLAAWRRACRSAKFDGADPSTATRSGR